MIKFDVSRGEQDEYYVITKKTFTKKGAKKLAKVLNQMQVQSKFEDDILTEAMLKAKHK